MDLKNSNIAVVGLGYVGLPLLVEFSKLYPTLGFDVSESRVDQLQKGIDRTLELDDDALAQLQAARFSTNPEDLQTCNVFIITVPTPVDKQNRPDLSPLITACEQIAPYLTSNNYVIFESTVYPGATEEVCIPVLEKLSGLTFNQDFFAGYSPERINPGDKSHRLTSITKLTSGSTELAATFVDSLYASIIPAGTYKASSIKVAEAAKVIENTQRDLNIALINELCIIFHKLGIDTEEVLKAAETKWNFLPFRPGIVGGHCISVDPYYLTHKAQEIGYHPEVILAGRRINDEMGNYIAERLIKHMTQNRINVVDARILVLGFSFKENCPDLRNTRVIDVVTALSELHTQVDVYDPWVDRQTVKEEYGLDLINEPGNGEYDAVIIAVAHDIFKNLGISTIRSFTKSSAVIFDVKYLFPQNENLYRL